MNVRITFILKSIYSILGAICIGNASWMLLSSESWFHLMPIAAEDTGPHNAHFVHDVGLVYLLVGISAFWCAYNLERCKPIHFFITCFITGHAAIHFIEIIIGALPIDHLWIDFPLITFPSIVLIGVWFCLPKAQTK